MPSKPRRPLEPTPALRCVQHDDIAMLRDMLAAGEPLDGQAADGRTALHLAVFQGNLDFVALLLEGGAAPSVADAAGLTPLHFAASEHRVEATHALLRANANVHAEDRLGNTPLMTATHWSRGRGEIITALLEAGADAHRENESGVSPLKLAETIANYPVRQWFPVD